ncbi:NAD+ synthase [Anaerolineae bacterium CFX9]|jgi:NAD+ synthase|nr:NAD+ synthase [Kamptonema cortianum]MDL1903013.1 NAD+ synthase [Anaerolineae bacterium CFX9]
MSLPAHKAAQINERLQINPAIARKMLVGFIKDQIEKIGMKRAVIGLSGGIDSALSAYLSAEALGAENVLAVRMPYRTSSADSLTDADRIIEVLGLPSLTVPITGMADALIDQFPHMSNLRKGNIMARLRMTILYDQSVEWGGLVMGTSNKTELLLGYSTVYGDSGVALQPIGDLYKTQVRQLSEALGVPSSVIQKPPSADLWEGQTDEGELGFTYADVDQMLYLLIDERYTVEELIEEGFSAQFVHSVWRRVKANHYKRTMPNIAKVSHRTIGHDFLFLRDWVG